MDKIVLFCKSYKGDLQRCIKLSESIAKYNIDDIPFYVSVPLEDTMMFQSELPYFTEILADEHITDNGHGWVGQQHVKSKFYKHELSKYYVCIDSDSYFIRDFYIDDFLYDEYTPYMIMHENKQFFEWCDLYGEEHLGFDPYQSFKEECESIKSFLNITGKKIHDYGPSPVIWDSSVWEEADDEFGIDLLLSKHATEMKWYGELANYYNVEYVQCNPLFKCFHYEVQYQWYKQLGWAENDFKKQYMGIVMQSNWGSGLGYGN